MANSYNKDPEQEARRITAAYLNTKGWAGTQKMVYSREPSRLRNKEELGQRFERTDSAIEQAESQLYDEIVNLKNDPTPSAQRTVKNIIRILDQRNDLSPLIRGFISRIKNTL